MKYEKFMDNMWDIGKELNKVILGFLRQLLGVHKKTCNVAIQAETGKYPICIKIFTCIIKYWIRITTSKNPLLKATNDMIIINHTQGKPSWNRIIEYLLQITKINLKPSENIKNNNEILTKFKREIYIYYQQCWKEQAITTGTNKLDFYYKHKKTFKYETYLDNIPKHIRTHITRLRVSSHSLPIEIQRYTKKDKKIERENRKCNICSKDEMGDEEHYLLKCNNSEISHTRENFLKEIRTDINQFEMFTDKNIIDYCLNVNDTNIQMKIALYVKNILNIYKEETEGTVPINPTPVVTRTGRLIKKTVKLHL